MMSGSASHSGKHALDARWAGSIESDHYSIQGNGLAGKQVLQAMEQAFNHNNGTLADRLVGSLVAGQKQGGQSTGSMSAAVLVSTKQGFPHDINLRVDAADKPVKELQRLLDFHYARQMIIIAERAARQDNDKLAWQWLEKGVKRGGAWDRVLRRAARLAIKLNNSAKASEYLGRFRQLNPTWFQLEIIDPLYRSLKNTEEFQKLNDVISKND